MIIGSIIGVGLFLICPSLAWYLVLLISYFLIFRKMGEQAWKALIPLYHLYVQMKHTWDTRYFWVGLACGCVSELMYIIYKNSDGATAAYVIGWLFSVVVVILGIINSAKLARAFGKGTVFTIGTAIIPPPFLFILGFGKSEYIERP